MWMEDIKIIRSKRKTISIEITADAEVIVRAPKHASVKVINDLYFDR